MIIKSKRVRARGQALKRAIHHITNGEDNDAIELVSGNVADLEDARADALRFGREYAARHWILSPDREISHEQLCYIVALLAVEFGFDPERVVIWKHTKGRATADGCSQHFHVLVAEVDPVTGRVMSSAHNYARHEKLARSAELAWGHAIVPGPHTAAVVAALEREGDAGIAATLRQIAPLNHPQSFNEADHQRAKREGIDLPRLREMISGALATAASRSDFDVRLAACGLRLRRGDRTDALIIETADGIFVGSLARLTRLREEALNKRMQFDAAAAPSIEADHSAGHILAARKAGATDGASVEARSRRRQPRPTGFRGHDDRPVATDGTWDRTDPHAIGKSGNTPGRSSGGQGDQEHHTRLKLASGCFRHQNLLLDLLGEARRSALPPLERVTSDLNDVIERQTRIHQTVALPEPTSLLAARRKVSETAQRLRTLEAEANGIEEQLADHPPASIWRRLWGSSGDPDGITLLEKRRDDVQRKILAARGNCAAATQALKIQEREFRVTCAHHESTHFASRAQADARIATARVARTLLQKNPRTAFWGAPYLMRLADNIRKTSGDLRPDEADNWDLVTKTDIWGIPYLPKPKVP